MEESAVVRAMKRYSKLGLPVIPCRGKVPLIKDWQKSKKASQKEINDWFIRWPDMNVGLVLGPASGIIGIDMDGEAAEEKFLEMAQGVVPETWTYKTPGGGKRYLYQLPKNCPTKKWILSLEGDHSELAFLGEGCQTIMPPSIHPNGGIYEWVEGHESGETELAPAPQWVLDRMSGKSDAKGEVHDKGAGTAEETSTEKYPAEEVFDRLASRCSKFKKALKRQTKDGLPEDLWFKWLRVLVSSGHPVAALEFSRMSTKHDSRSDERHQKLEEESQGQGPMPRCISFGCTVEGVEGCFLTLNLNDRDEATNSPGGWVREMERLLPPSDTAYAPYIQALESVPEYDVDEQGNLCGYDRKGNPFAIANFVARPVLEVVRDDGSVEDRTFRIEGILAGGRTLSPVDVSALDFVAMNWILNAWGISAAIRAGQGKRDQLRDAVQSVGKDVERLTIYTHLGFRQLPDGYWVYLHAGGCIGAEGVTVETEKALERYHLPEKVKDPVTAAKASLRLLDLAPRRIMIPLLALVYLSPLTEAFRLCGLEPNFVIWLYGGTGTRKTSLALALLSHFRNFETKTPPASFKDTANAIEKRAFATKDTLLLIDDYHPESSKYESDKMAQVAQRILRMYGDRIGRGRLKATLELQKSFPPRGMALVTGEDLPQGQSSVARFAGVEMLQGDVDLKVLTWAQQNARLLSEAMTEYIMWLLPQMDQLPKILAEEFRETRAMFQDDKVHGRLGETAAWLDIAYNVMLTFMMEVGTLEKEEATSLYEEAEATLKDLIQRQGRLVNEEKPPEIFMRSLKELMTTGKVRLEPLKLSSQDELFLTGNKIGWEDDKFFYLLPEATYNAVSRSLSARGQKLPVLERALWRQLDEAGAIYVETGSDGRVQRCPKKTIPKRQGQKEAERPRVLHLHKMALEKVDE